MNDDPIRMTVNIDELTLGELEEFEEATDLRLVGGDLDKMPMKALVYLVYLAQRKADPAYTLEDARSLKMGDIEIMGGTPIEDEEPDPTSAVNGTAPREIFASPV